MAATQEWAPNFLDEKDPQPEANPAVGRNRKSKGIIRELIPLKIVTLLVYSGMAALYPFITLHMKSIGITLTETAVISFLLPTVCCIGMSLAGRCAEKIGHYKILIIVLTALHVTFHLLLLGVPPFKEHEIRSRTAVDFMNIEFDCKSHDNAFFTSPELQGISNCISDNSGKPNNELQFESCWTDCPSLEGYRIPSICFLNATSRTEKGMTKGHACSKWTELEGQLFKGITFHPSQEESRKGSWEMSEYQNDEGGTLHSARCLWEAEKVTATTKCGVFCQASSTAELVCSSVFVEGNHMLTLLAYFFLRLFGLMALMSKFLILDTATMELTLQHGGRPGYHRILAALAFVVLPPLSGYLVGGPYSEPAKANFLAAFVIFGTCNVAAAIVMLFTKLPTNLPLKGIGQNLGKVLKHPQVIAVLCVMFMIGMAQGYTASFLYWFLEDLLSAPKWLLGIGTAVANLVAIPLYIVSYTMIHKIGYANLLIIVLLLNFGRFVAYSYLGNANVFPVVEVMTAFTIFVVYAVPTHSRATAPKYVSTFQTLVKAITFGLGFGTGPLIGGILISWMDYRLSFRLFSLIFLVTAIIFTLIYYLCLKKIIPVSPEIADKRSENDSTDNNWRISDLDWEGDSAMLYKEKAPPTAEFEQDFWSHKFRPLSTDSWKELRAQGFIFPKNQKSSFV